MLPSGPPWKWRSLPLQHPTKYPVRVFFRDPVDCLRCLMANPLHADHIDFKPFRAYKDREMQTRVFTEWLSGDVAWTLQVSLDLFG